MRADNAHHIVAAARRRSIDCRGRVEAVLDDIELNGGPADITTIAQRARVSRTYLYDPNQQHLLERLRAIRQQIPTANRRPLPAEQRISTTSHERIVKALRARNQQLAEENKQLRAELAIAFGQLRELRRAQPPGT